MARFPLRVSREFTDCRLVAIVGPMSNVVNMIAWALFEIMTDSGFMVSQLTEINDIPRLESTFQFLIMLDSVVTEP